MEMLERGCMLRIGMLKAGSLSEKITWKMVMLLHNNTDKKMGSVVLSFTLSSNAHGNLDKGDIYVNVG